MSSHIQDPFGKEICRKFEALVDQLLHDKGIKSDQPQHSAATKKLVFVIDETTRFLDRWRTKLTGEKQPDPPDEEPSDNALPGKGILETVQSILVLALSRPDHVAKRYAAFAGEALLILRDKSTLKPEPGDYRFKDELWQTSPLYRTLMQLYLAWSQNMQGWVEDQHISPQDRKRIDFILSQAIAAFAPSNLPLNPTALKRAQDSEGASAVTGLRHWMEDVVTNRAMPRQIKKGAYQVGVDLGITKGAVVFRNEQLELIQYESKTEHVQEYPVLLIPPQINKYYIFDLRPRNSVLAHLVHSGLQVFTISWRNPDHHHQNWNLDTYIQAVHEAVEAIHRISKAEKINLISACAGGLTGMSLIGYLQETGHTNIASHSLLVTSLFGSFGSALDLFATSEGLERVRRYGQINGVMEGRELAHVFAWLRPNDLVWRYWVNNYLMGREPPSLDVLYWDNDPTRLPAALHSDFLDIYANDVFRTPNSLKVLGRAIDFQNIELDTYFVGGDEDYIMPWQGCYHAYTLFKGNHQFVLSTSGHVQSILRPPRLPHTAYFMSNEKPLLADEWLSGTQKYEGSWWGHWHGWLKDKSGETCPAPAEPGCPGYPVLMDAPGSYVMG